MEIVFYLLTPAGPETRPKAIPVKSRPNWKRPTSEAVAWHTKLRAINGATNIIVNRRPYSWPRNPPKIHENIVANVGKLAKEENF